MYFQARFPGGAAPFHFQVNPLEGNNSGFSLLNVERSTVVAALNKLNPSAKQSLWPEIYTAFEREYHNVGVFDCRWNSIKWSVNAQNPAIIKKGMDLFQKLVAENDALEQKQSLILKELPNAPRLWKNTIAYLAIELSQAKALSPERREAIRPLYEDLKRGKEQYDSVQSAFETYCKTDEVFQCYIEDGLGKELELGCRSALMAAKALGINLRVWHRLYDEENSLEPATECRQLHPLAPGTLNVINALWEEMEHHFDSLQLLLSTNTPVSEARQILQTQRTPMRPAWVQELCFLLLNSKEASIRRQAVFKLSQSNENSVFLIHCLLAALRDSDPLVLALVDKTLIRLGIDRHQFQEAVSIIMFTIIPSKSEIFQVISLDKKTLTQAIPLCAEKVPPSFPPAWDKSEGYIRNTRLQKTENGVTTITQELGGFRSPSGNMRFFEGAEKGMFDNPESGLPKEVANRTTSEITAPAAAAPTAPVKTNEMENLGTNFIKGLARLLQNEAPPQAIAILTKTWQKVEKDQMALQAARKGYKSLSNAQKERLVRVNKNMDKALSS